ncbi:MULTISPECIES: HAD family hydrolase [Actinomyces]|uniref:Hydrolase n=1 Tax=Actinomyces oris TaxID=544580 RepID=A0A1Q8VYQ7_9ACTO|nr:HAD-IB family hydrolase [Actinomyces oris]OLO53590.1 hydrolase [Actinomyces oris]OLO56488.1 hydrolase [Actinomyces oris]
MSAQDRASVPSRQPATSPVTAPTAPPGAPERPPAGPPPTGHRAAAYFDLDKTILATSSTWALGTPMRRSGLISSRALAHGLIAQIPYLLVGAGAQRSSSLMEHLALMSAGISRRDLVEVVEGALTTAIEPAVYAEALDLIEGHRRAGHDVVVVSASITEMVAPIARLVGADRAVATHMEVGEDGLFTGRISRSMLHSEKVVALREDAAAHGIDPARCWAYSDSISDEPMLSAVGHPVAVNPDRDLRRLAQERDWPVRDFARPVRLRPRWEPPSLSTRASIIAHVAGVLAVGGTAAWLMARRGPRSTRGI